MQSTNLLCNLESGAGEFATIAQQFLGTLATRNLKFSRKLFKLLQPSFIELANVLQSLHRALEIFFAAVFVLFCLHLIRKSNHIANVEFAFCQLISDAEQFDYGDR